MIELFLCESDAGINVGELLLGTDLYSVIRYENIGVLDTQIQRCLANLRILRSDDRYANDVGVASKFYINEVGRPKRTIIQFTPYQIVFNC